MSATDTEAKHSDPAASPFAPAFMASKFALAAESFSTAT